VSLVGERQLFGLPYSKVVLIQHLAIYFADYLRCRHEQFRTPRPGQYYARIYDDRGARTPEAGQSRERGGSDV
jgi:hypothetical protein